MIRFRVRESLRFVRIFSLVLFAITLSIWFFPATEAYAVDGCCVESTACLSSGYSLQDCPNDDEVMCYLCKGDCVNMLECMDIWFLANPIWCRADCDSEYMILCGWGCGVNTSVVKTWEKWDLNDPQNRNPRIGCYASLCFCPDDMACTGITWGYIVGDDDWGNCVQG